jgi:mannose-1-phosphate guanylyltransferase/mannose-6-phosphate isomerase
MFRASSYLEELERFEPDIYRSCTEAMAHETPDLDFFRPSAAFLDCPSQSIDYAVLERTERALVMRLEIGWSDLGSWRALWEIAEKDDAGNAISGDVIAIDSKNSLLRAETRLLTTIGLEDVVVVETADAVLVAQKNAAQSVRDLVGKIRDATRTEHHSHLRVYRPWGSYESLESDHGFQVKRIVVSPGASLSLQLHHHRSEHWIVVKGIGIVQKGDEEFELRDNESTYIPVECKHRLSNRGTESLEIIEVQVGSYLGEDDIVRYTDDYGRA